MSIQDQLLYDILTTYGPCPDICCGKNEAFGGPMGIDVTDINTVLILLLLGIFFLVIYDKVKDNYY
jgi:hypothetical protein